jgi:hypothetical protein
MKIGAGANSAKTELAMNRVLSTDALRSDDVQINQNELHNDTMQKEIFH